MNRLIYLTSAVRGLRELRQRVAERLAVEVDPALLPGRESIQVFLCQRTPDIRNR